MSSECDVVLWFNLREQLSPTQRTTQPSFTSPMVGSGRESEG